MQKVKEILEDWFVKLNDYLHSRGWKTWHIALFYFILLGQVTVLSVLSYIFTTIFLTK